jgi:hypothetical protein
MHLGRPSPQPLTARAGGLDGGRTQPRNLLRRMFGRRAAAVVAIGMAGWLSVATAQVPMVRILHPQPEQTINDNTGTVRVSVDVQGSALAPDHHLRVLIDGQVFGPEQLAPVFTLQDIERGEHALQVQLMNAKNTVVAVSSPVRFYVWRASALFPARKPATIPGK